MKNALRFIPLAILLLSPASASALPRFAARTGNECIQCHVNPSGGGVRNNYGRNVFMRSYLALDSLAPTEELGLDLSEDDLAELEASFTTEQESSVWDFTGDVTEWLALGADFRAAYIWSRPDQGLSPDSERNIMSSFFLMEAYMYMAATVHEHVQFVLQLGVYSGFEAWGLFRLQEEGSEFNVLAKVGRFMPAFGIREAQHQLFTREFIGLGNADRDTGLEITGYMGPVTTQVSILNGTLGNISLDTTGTERRTFEKAVVARASLRGDFGWLRGQIGGSFYFSENNSEPNPLFTGSIPAPYLGSTGLGVNEIRAGAFLMANAGRLTYLADLVYVRDQFFDPNIPVFDGYTSYQELSFLAVQGLDVVAMFEFMDPNISLRNNTSLRAGLAVEFFPWPSTEFRVMVRRLWSEPSPTGGNWDVVAFVHLFL